MNLDLGSWRWDSLPTPRCFLISAALYMQMNQKSVAIGSVRVFKRQI